MRNLFILFFICLPAFVVAQINSKDKSESNIEKFSGKSGTLIQKEFEDIGNIKSCKIQVARFTDLINGQKTSGIRFEKEYVSSYSSSSDTKIAFLDKDEVDGLIKSLNLIKNNILQTSPTNYTEVNYKSRGGFMAGCFSSKKGWSLYLQLEQFDSNSYVFFDSKDIDELLSLIQNAQNKL